MSKRYRYQPFQKILVPVVYGCDYRACLAAAQVMVADGQILLVGIVPVEEGESLSQAAVPARHLRKILHNLIDGEEVRIRERVRVAHKPWNELVKIVEEESPDLLVLAWPCQLETLRVTPAEVLARPACNLAIASGPISLSPQKVLVSLRGGPSAELALRISLSISRTCQAEIASLHLVRPGFPQDAPYRGLGHVLSHLPEIQRLEMQTDNPAQTIAEVSRQYDLTILGATARPDQASAFGPVAEVIHKEGARGVILVKSMLPAPANFESEAAGQTAISVLVDQWFGENTFHANEFADLDLLLALKQRQNLTISLALPALNEEQTVGKVIAVAQAALMRQVPLLDEIVLIDSNSSDRTRQIASQLGVPVYIHQETLPQVGSRNGKGEALWKSLYVTCGDIVLWIDTDIVNIHPRFIYGLLGPLLLRPDIQFVKGFYRRPLKVGDKLQAGAGGRVTELTARPLLNLFYPELSGLIQPLSGEYGGRRSTLEQMPFFSGYGVEIGLLIDVLEKYGLDAIAQVDLQERVHHNQELEALSKMSFAIIQAVMRKLESRYGGNMLEEVNKTMKLIRYEPGRFFLDIEEIAEQERPPMATVEAYTRKGSFLPTQQVG